MFLLRRRAAPVASALALLLPIAASGQERTVDGDAGQSGAAPAKADQGESEQPHELEGFVIEGKLVPPPSSAPSTTQTLGEEQLATFEEDDVHQVLLQVPGVQVRGEDGVGLRPNIGIRGTSPNRSTKITLMEDGVLFAPAPYSAPAAYYFPQVTRMKSVEVHKGGAQLLYGPRALGGALNLVTADIPQGPSAAGDLAFGEYGYKKLHLRGGYGNERTGFLLEGVHVDSSGFKELDGGGDTGFNKNEFMAKWRINSKPSAEIYQEFNVKLGVSTENSNETYLGLTDADFADTPYRRYAASDLDEMRWHRGQAVATYVILPSDDFELEVTAYETRFTRDWFKLDSLGGATLDEVLANPESPSNRIYYEILTGEANTSTEDELLIHTDNYRWYLTRGIAAKARNYFSTGSLDHDLESGARFHFDRVNRQHTEFSYRMTGAGSDEGFELEASGAPAERITENRGRAHALSLHLVDTLTYDDLTLTPGLRAEITWTDFRDSLDPTVDNSRTQVGILPGAGAHYAITEKLGVLGGVYRGFGPVAPQAQGPDTRPPKPESSITYEAGSRYDTSDFHAELTGYLVSYQNLTANCSTARGCDPSQVGQQFDGGRARVLGLEAVLAREFTAGDFRFPARATYALSHGSLLDSFSSPNPEWGDVEAGDELPYLPRHQGTASLGIADERRWGVDVSGTFVSSAREVAGSGEVPVNEKTDAYGLLGLAARLRLISELWLYARGTNLLDAAYLTSRRPHGARPGAPRWIHVGLKFEL